MSFTWNHYRPKHWTPIQKQAQAGTKARNGISKTINSLLESTLIIELPIEIIISTWVESPTRQDGKTL